MFFPIIFPCIGHFKNLVIVLFGHQVIHLASQKRLEDLEWRFLVESHYKCTGMYLWHVGPLLFYVFFYVVFKVYDIVIMLRRNRGDGGPGGGL